VIAKFAYGGSILSSSHFFATAPATTKNDAIKVVEIDSKRITLLP
jgi:hypothetical protein